jgi:hypothetical protein
MSMRENPYEPIRVFLSSKQAEFVEERAGLTEIIKGVPLLAAVAAEEWSPQRELQERYLADVRRCPIYVGLFGHVYSEPTAVEYQTAKEHARREILIYVKGGVVPEPRLADLLEHIRSEHVINVFLTFGDLAQRFETHLWDAVSRMLQAYMQLSTPPPVPRGGGVSPLLRKWEQSRAAWQGLGLPGADSPEDAGWWFESVRTALRSR